MGGHHGRTDSNGRSTDREREPAPGIDEARGRSPGPPGGQRADDERQPPGRQRPAQGEWAARDERGHDRDPGQDRGPGQTLARGRAPDPAGGGYGAGNAAWGSSHERYQDERDDPRRAGRAPERTWSTPARWWPGGWGGPAPGGSHVPQRSEREDRDWSTAERNIEGRSARPSDEPRRTGKPPRNYQRADARILEDICEMITAESDVDASEVEIRVEGGEVTFTGFVRDRRDKRELEDVTERVLGVKDVHNQVRIRG